MPTRRELAKVLAAKGDLTGAIENLQRALSTQRRIFERGDHPDIAATMCELERLQALQRDVQRPD
ncbi:MAG TPA: tetratricopeptide repeat protein [Kofleriaceae bacterium]